MNGSGGEWGFRRTRDSAVSEIGQSPRWRRIASWVLVVLACLLAVVSVMVVFVRNQLLNTDAYVSTMAPLATNPAIQTQIATRVSDGLVTRTDLSHRVRNKVADMREPGRMSQDPVHGFVAVHRRALQWSVLELGILVLVIWSNPTTLVAVVVTLLTLAIVGLVGLFAGRGSRLQGSR